MAARLTDLQRQKIVADYIETESINAAAKRNNVSWATAAGVLEEIEDIEKKLEEKKRQNTTDILAYMDGQKQDVCEVLSIGLAELKRPDKFAKTPPQQIATTLAILIDKYAVIGGSGPSGEKEDELSQSLRELGRELKSDD